jgi:hypothetical protein
MVARRKITSNRTMRRAITDLADVRQEFISVDPPTLALSRKLDRESGEEGVGRRFKAATKVLPGRARSCRSRTNTRDQRRSNSSAYRFPGFLPI